MVGKSGRFLTLGKRGLDRANQADALVNRDAQLSSLAFREHLLGVKPELSCHSREPGQASLRTLVWRKRLAIQ